MIRPAARVDIPDIIGLMQRIFEQSVYHGLGEIDRPSAMSLFMWGVEYHGTGGPGGTLLNVSERDGEIHGLHYGMLDRICHIGTKLVSSDVYFYQDEHADPCDAIRLFDAYLDWAEGNGNVLLLRQGRAMELPGDPERIGKLYKRRGFHYSGAIYEKEVNR